MLASVLALPRIGVDMVRLEVVLRILLVIFQAMKLSGHQWPLVTEDIEDGCLQRLTAHARFNEGLPQELATKVLEQFHTEHAERYLLDFVYGWLGDHDLMGVRTEAEKCLTLGALNLVQCVGFVGVIKPARWRVGQSSRQDGRPGRSQPNCASASNVAAVAPKMQEMGLFACVTSSELCVRLGSSGSASYIGAAACSSDTTNVFTLGQAGRTEALGAADFDHSTTWRLTL